MEKEHRTPLESAEAAARKAEAEFAKNPTDATEAKMRGAQLFVNSVREKAAKHPEFNQRPPES